MNVFDRLNIFLYVKMRSAKHDERIFSYQKSFKWNSRILILKLCREHVWPAQYLPPCVKIRSAKHDERIASAQETF